jgi:tetratricopeptide (TPR) repeat protein
MLGMALFAGLGATSCKQIESRDLIREGNAAYNDGQYAEAIEAYTKSIEIEEDGVKVFWNRGCAALALVLKLRGATEPEKLEQRKTYTNMALKDFKTWLDRADEEEEDAGDVESPEEGEGAEGGAAVEEEDKRTNEEIVRDYRLTLLDADERCDDLLQYWMDKHKAEPREESWYTVVGRQYDKCGQPEKRVEWMKKRAEDFPDSVKAWHALAIDAFEPLWPDPEKGLPYNEDLAPADRIKQADKVIELLDKANAIDRKFLDAYTWRSMAYTQRMFARTVVEDAEFPEERLEAILAREDSMLAWKNQKAKCDLEGTKECPADLSTLAEGETCCPGAPLTAAEQAEDATAKTEILAEMAAADAEAAAPPKKKRRRRKK